MRRLKGVFPEGVVYFCGLFNAQVRVAGCDGSGGPRQVRAQASVIRLCR